MFKITPSFQTLCTQFLVRLCENKRGKTDTATCLITFETVNFSMITRHHNVYILIYGFVDRILLIAPSSLDLHLIM